MSLLAAILSTVLPAPGLYVLHSLPILAACSSGSIVDASSLASSAAPIIVTGIHEDEPTFKSLPAAPLSDGSAWTVPARHDIDSRDHSTGRLFELPLADRAFNRRGVAILSPLQCRGIWNGSDTFDWCMNVVCQNVSRPLEVLCNETYLLNNTRSQFSDWTCDNCYPCRNEFKLKEHCLGVAKRLAVMLQTVVGLLLAFTSLSLIVWTVAMLNAVRQYRPIHIAHEGPFAKVKWWYQKLFTRARKAREDAEPLKPAPNKLRKKRTRKGLVPVMPPAHSLFSDVLLSDQVDGNFPDIETGMLRRISAHSTRSADRAVSSGAQHSQESAASRRPSASDRGTMGTDGAREAEDNASGLMKDPRQLGGYVDGKKTLHLSFSQSQPSGAGLTPYRRPADLEVDYEPDLTRLHPGYRRANLESGRKSRTTYSAPNEASSVGKGEDTDASGLSR